MYVCVRLCMYIYIYIHYTNNISNNHVCIYSYCTYTSYNHILCFFSYLLEASLYETNDLGVAKGPVIHGQRFTSANAGSAKWRPFIPD